MNKTDAISFWTPIVPSAAGSITTKEWARSKADRLLSFGREFYRLDPKDTLVLEQGPELSWKEIAIKAALIATLILPLVALIIKIIDRMSHKYTLFVTKDPSHSKLDDLPPPPPPGQTPPASPRPSRTSPAPTIAEILEPSDEEWQAKMREEKHQTSALEAELQAQEAKLAAEIREAEAKKNAKTLAEAENERKQKEEAMRRLNVAHKSHQVALRFFPKMLETYYRPDGQLNNEFVKAEAYYNFWGHCRLTEDEIDLEDPSLLKKLKYPEDLRKVAKLLQEEGQNEKAEPFLKKAEENAKARDNKIAAMQQTLFPLSLDYKTTLTAEECFKECQKDFSKQEFFHGTTKARAPLIQKEGFDPESPEGGNRTLDTGYGAYLALHESDSAGYARKDIDQKGAILRIRVKPNLKIAEYDQKIYQLVDDFFARMAWDFICDHKEAICQELVKEGVRKEGDLSTASEQDVRFPILNLFTREFYARQGFRGVYTIGSPRAQCGYLNLFHPKEDIVSIT